ncbi:Aste57867_7395 [Aphanomyces stellatus]|uniref:Aste57867_3882 protein n=1 Tax=Aphanomyces stellatus TaxID=120398 RepID=A0A485KI94_9STRA|nr:hypothetical protein As57867_007369 [Aphanomyces stellatus]KAF0714410.1 hypothetical protein As57867_003871 [Aphanomyces stellatus]VFT81027.1 Aste57867_3882 [Aphanomyces stellatus]VFT84310.1 Aste57867_7395 [Aphanomyces stellatus]
MFSLAKTVVVLALVALSPATSHEHDDAESICGVDHTKGAVCYNDTDTVKYKAGNTIARLITNDDLFCSGWLFGSEGHLLTANSCIANSEEAKHTTVEFGAECKTCNDPANNKPKGCAGVQVTNSTTLVFTDYTLDFSLVKVDVSDSVALVAKYGYLQARDGPAILDEPIYIMGHPGFKPKRFSVFNDDGKPTKITNTSTPSLCSETDTLGYNADTEGGSSGSPVVGVLDNKVVALHNCGGCKPSGEGQNTGNKMDKIVALLKAKKLLPKDAVAGGAC